MNKLRLGVAAVGAALALWGSPALNAREGKSGDKEGQGAWSEERQEKIFKELGLDAAQADKLKALRKEQAEAMKPLREKRKADFEQLRSLVDKKGSDADLSAALSALKADQQAIEEQQKKQREAGAALLTPRQQALMVLRMGEGLQRMGEAWGKGHKDGHRWRKDKGRDKDHGDY